MNLLVLLLLVPLLGTAACALAPKPKVARQMALFFSLLDLLVAALAAWRFYAAGKFFLFTFTGSVFTLAAAIYLGLKYGTFDITGVIQGVQGGYNGAAALSTTERFWVCMGFLAGFAVKVPLFPVHTWLPLAH